MERSAEAMSKGRFITVEGIEGAGKSTHLTAIRDLIQSAGHTVLLTREPGGTPLGEGIRQLLLRPDLGPMSPEAELLLLFGARAEHLARVIRPALDAGQWVLCDRFTDATYAYQGGGRGLPAERIVTLERWVHGDLQPDLTLLFDLPIATGLARVAHRGAEDRFEQEERAFFERVQAAYRARAERFPGRFRVIDTDAEPDEVRLRVERALRPWL